MIFILKVIHKFLADVFKNLKELCLKIYHLDPAKPFSVPVLAWEEALKKAEVKLE